jgi:hypothetical protein
MGILTNIKSLQGMGIYALAARDHHLWTSGVTT